MGNISEQRKLLAQRLRDARLARDMTQAQLARKVTTAGLPMGTTTITKIEAGNRSVELVEAIALADALDLSWESLNVRGQEMVDQIRARLHRQAEVALWDAYRDLRHISEVVDTMLISAHELGELEDPPIPFDETYRKVDYILADLNDDIHSSYDLLYQAGLKLGLHDDSSGIPKSLLEGPIWHRPDTDVNTSDLLEGNPAENNGDAND